MVISYDNFFSNLIAGVVFFALCGVAIFILYKIGAFVFRRLKNTDVIVKILPIIRLLTALFVLGIAMFWFAFFAFYYIGGGGPLR